MKSRLLPVIFGAWLGCWAGFFSFGCGGGGGDAAETIPNQTSSSSTEQTVQCYCAPNGENLGEVGSEEGEDALSDAMALKVNIYICACNSTVNIDQSTHDSHDSTTSSTEVVPE